MSARLAHIHVSAVRTAQTNAIHVYQRLLHHGSFQPQEDANRHALLKPTQNNLPGNVKHVLATVTDVFHRTFARLVKLDFTTMLHLVRNCIHKVSPNAWMRVQLLQSPTIPQIHLPARNVQVLAIHVKELPKPVLPVRMAIVSTAVNVLKSALLITSLMKTMFVIGLVRESYPSSL